jgi:hypothetical protein
VVLLGPILWSGGLYGGAELPGVSKQSSGRSGDLISTDTKITAVFVVLGVASWYGATRVTDSQLVQFALLLGVGLIAPTLINEWRT